MRSDRLVPYRFPLGDDPLGRTDIHSATARCPTDCHRSNSDESNGPCQRARPAATCQHESQQRRSQAVSPDHKPRAAPRCRPASRPRRSSPREQSDRQCDPDRRRPRQCSHVRPSQQHHCYQRQPGAECLGDRFSDLRGASIRHGLGSKERGAGWECRLSLRERPAFRGAKGDSHVCVSNVGEKPVPAPSPPQLTRLSEQTSLRGRGLG